VPFGTIIKQTLSILIRLFWLRIYKVMGKVRLQDLAKELGVKVKDVQGLLKEWGIEKNNFAYLEEEEVQIVLDHFGKETTQEIKEEKREEKVERVQEKEPPKEKKPPQKVKEEERKKETFKREEKPLPKKEEKSVHKPKPVPQAVAQPAPKPPSPPPLPKVEVKEEKKAKKEEEQILKKLEKQIEKKKKEEQEEEIKIVQIPEIITVRELAELLRVPPNVVMAELLKKGVLATINQTVPSEVALQVAEALGFLAEVKKEEEVLEEEIPDHWEKLPRPPIVVVTGHVDHGKTTLLDAIRKTNVAQREKGGITQHIGASVVQLPDGRKITFLDTPGHEAFTSLRARGSQVTDIAVLVVAADDGVMPQTVEAINHAKAFNVPIIVAVNKIDKPGADPQRVRRELSELGLIPEEWGGDTIFVDVSAKTGQNVESLLEYILLMAELLELKARVEGPAKGTVIESKLDKQKGPTATLLVQEGTLRVGDPVVAGTTYGKIRAMFDDKGRKLNSAGPSTPVEVLGFEELPIAGDTFMVVEDEKKARQIAEIRKQKKEQQEKLSKGLMLEEVFKKIEEGELKELKLILKTDTVGSLEALKKALTELSTPEVSVRILHGAVGGITENDVMLAKASQAIIIGFNTRPDLKAKETAEREKVDIKLYSIIYEAIEDVKNALRGMLKPVQKEVVLGSAEVRATFKIKGVGTVAGCYVLDGKIVRNANARLIRDGVVIYTGKIEGLKRFKEDVQEVARGFECGIKLKDYNDVKVGDVIECYEVRLEKPSL
jgi:translation initiation factor IF-2